MTDYKHTLNLPNTSFSMKANLAQQEPKTLAHWQAINLYQKIRTLRAGQKKFILYDGPPYANGDIHIGHAVNKILKDIVIKSKNLSSFDVPFIPGWDGHGLPIELNVEKKKGKAGHKISATEFRAACREYVEKQIDGQRAAFKRLGVLGDWEHPYRTTDFQFEANIILALSKIIENGYVYHGFKPVHWCMDCTSALAEAEVEYQDKTSLALDVGFVVVDISDLLRRFTMVLDRDFAAKIDDLKSVAVPIWTTTPWTLPANQAVALNPSVNYVLVRSLSNHCLLIAEALLPSAMQRFKWPDYTIEASCSGEKLVGLLLQHPFLPKQVPVILGDHVTVDTGTGAVHTAPAHGQDDHKVASLYELPMESPVDERGYFIAGTPLFAGEHIFRANDAIVQAIRDNGALLCVESIQHSYPHCWRHKTPLIFRATAQWFIGFEQNHLRKKVLSEIEKVQWLPAWGKTRIAAMVENRPDWCISRQRNWGTPIALFVDKLTGEMHPNTPALMQQVASLVAQKGIDAWFDLNAEDLLGDNAAQYRKVTDTLDVWFDSGVAHSSAGLDFLADLYLEGDDQHRGWFQSALITAVAMHGEAPYKTVLTHGFTVDGQGHKMSKSLGNVVAPDTVMKTLGADILRLWVASTDYRGEMHVSDEIFKRTSDSYRRIRNTARFLLSVLHDFDPQKKLIPADNMLALDYWAVERAGLLQIDIQNAYDNYQFHRVCKKLQQFCSVDMGSFYLDIIKDRVYTLSADSLARRSAQTAMYHILQILVRCLAPILSFTAEEIWQGLPGDHAESVFLIDWYTAADEFKASALTQDFWEHIMQVRDEVNKGLEAARTAGFIGAGLDAEVVLYANDHWYSILTKLGEELHFVLITSTALVLPDKQGSNSAVNTTLSGLSFEIKASPNNKCARCWHRSPDLGQNKNHPELCQRCISNIEGSGEKRFYV